MATLAELKNDFHDSQFVRKFLDGVAIIAPYSAPPIDDFIDTDGSLKRPAEGYSGLGIVEKDSGYEFGSDADQEEVEGHGYSSPVRIDVVKATKTVEMTCLETRRSVLEQYYGMDLSQVRPSEKGTVEFAEPELPSRPFCRLAIIGQDGVGEDTYWYIKFMPRAQVTEVDSHAWNKDAAAYPMTFTAFTDPDLGYSVKHILAGPGMKKAAQAMGFHPAGASGDSSSAAD